MSKFNAKSARAKRPCPLWVDAFQRDTQHLGADEVGVYMLLLMAMWTRETCDLPDDDGRLAKVGRVSKRLWDSRIGPVLRPFFTVDNGALLSKRLRIEADFVERFCKAQSDRKSGTLPESDPLAKPTGAPDDSGEYGEKLDKPLNLNNQASTTDATTESPGHHPTQQPNNLHRSSSSSSSARECANADDLLSEVMAAVGLKNGIIPAHWMPPASTIHVSRWQTDLGLTASEIIETAHESRKRHDEPPSGPKALDRAMKALSGAKRAPPMQADAAASGFARAPPPKRLWNLNPDAFNDDGSLKK